VHRRRPRKLTTVAANPLEASRSTREGDSRMSQGESCDALHWSGHGEPLAPARLDNSDGGGRRNTVMICFLLPRRAAHGQADVSAKLYARWSKQWPGGGGAAHGEASGSAAAE
jgi:hypothetical protein